MERHLRPPGDLGRSASLKATVFLALILALLESSTFGHYRKEHP